MPAPHKPITLALFCRVVDNFGDIGICWRLARQLQHEHGVAVTLWVDDLRSFARICPAIAVNASLQQQQDVTIRHWDSQDGQFAASDVADLVIEFFGCDLPPGYIAAMTECMPRPVWINFEGLTAEEWVEGCHTLPSPHPRLPLTKHFFFPGYTARTGGLLREAALEGQRAQFQADPAACAAFLAGLGVRAEEQQALLVSLFCYPQAPLAKLFDAWQNGLDAVTCLVPEGVAVEAVERFLGARAVPGAVRRRASLTLRVLPFVAQADYDRILWACDLNFVRGEDSLVRAQWACKPFIWHIYLQDENLHHVKLRAFLQRFAPQIDSLNAFSLGWNGAPDKRGQTFEDWPAQWTALRADLPKITARAIDWAQETHRNGDFSSNLMKFFWSLRS